PARGTAGRTGPPSSCRSAARFRSPAHRPRPRRARPGPPRYFPSFSPPGFLLGDQPDAPVALGDLEREVAVAEPLADLAPLALEPFQEPFQPVSAHFFYPSLFGRDVPIEEIPVRIGRAGAPLFYYGGRLPGVGSRRRRRGGSRGGLGGAGGP